MIKLVGLLAVIAVIGASPDRRTHGQAAHSHHHRGHQAQFPSSGQMAEVPTTKLCYHAYQRRCLDDHEVVDDPFTCNTCTCTRSRRLACTRMYCPKQGCQFEGRLWAVNQTFQHPRFASQCSCTARGVVMCTMDFTPRAHCKYEGQVYQAGENFQAKDCCNSCTCATNGEVLCTMKYCPQRSPARRRQHTPDTEESVMTD